MVNLGVNHNNVIKLLRQKDKKRVLFVCLGNICRSPAAEGIMRRIISEHSAGERWEIDSAGIGGWHIGDLPDKRMRLHARDRGITLDHICRQIRPMDFDEYDMIIGMDSSNIEDLRDLAPSPEALEKIFAMSSFVDDTYNCNHIPDPYYSGSEGFELVLDLLENGCRNLYENID